MACRRKFWKLDRSLLGDEANGNADPFAGSPFHGEKGLKISDAARSAFSTMIKGQQGPFTQEQSKAGFECSQTGQVLAGRLKIAERMAYRALNRVDANRSATHSTKTGAGMDLSADMGTAIRDAFKLPVMSGTSGSSSDAALAAQFGAARAGVSWSAPGLSETEAKQAIADLSHHYFRAEGSSPPDSMQKGINAVRSSLGIPIKTVETADIFTHSFAEIYSGVALTIDGAKPNDEEAMKKSTMEAVDLLRTNAPGKSPASLT
jgi:hypothetical protein